MAQFELNIYNDDFEIVKKHEADIVKWKVLLQALEFYDNSNKQGISLEAQLESINSFVKKIFPKLTDEELENADMEDVLNTFKQLIKKANAIKGTPKNAAGAE